LLPAAILRWTTTGRSCRSDEDGGYIADIPDLEACSAFGTTPEEALGRGRAGEGGLVGSSERGGETDSAGTLGSE
jgi:hypothetical protein